LQQLIADGMAQGIVDVFEAVEIQKEYGEVFFLAASQGNGLSDAVAQQHAIGEVGDDIVLGGVGHLKRDCVGRGGIVKNDDRADDAASAVVERGGGILDDRFEPVAPDEEAIIGQAYRAVLFNRYLQEVTSRFAGPAIDEVQDFGERLAHGLIAAPAGHGLGDRV
jgi:hypothetical protein